MRYMLFWLKSGFLNSITNGITMSGVWNYISGFLGGGSSEPTVPVPPPPTPEQTLEEVST